MVKELTVEAKPEKNSEVVSFVIDELVSLNVPEPVRKQMAIATEEIFLNIANYAYGSEPGSATLQMDTDEANSTITLTFIDSGMEFDPLAKEDPDLFLTLEERPIGGLGILMVKKIMDHLSYIREDGQNRFTISKKWA